MGASRICTRTSPKNDTSAAAAAAANDPDYKIGPQDVLRIDIWKEVDISRTTPVGPDGKISLPLINDVQAAGLTPMQLTAVITEGLKKYITNAPSDGRPGRNQQPAHFCKLRSSSSERFSSSWGIHAIREDQRDLRVTYGRGEASEVSLQL
jgi:hypothetical protein